MNDEVWHHWLNNVMNYTLAVNWGIKIRTGPLKSAVWPVWNGWQIGLRVLGTWTLWREPQDHSSDCYFCITQIEGVSSKSKHTVKYPNLPSAMRPVPHSKDLTYITSSYTSNSRRWIGTWGSCRSSKWGARWCYFWNKYIFLWTSSVNSRFFLSLLSHSHKKQQNLV